VGWKARRKEGWGGRRGREEGRGGKGKKEGENRKQAINDKLQFSDVIVSQDSVATYARCGGILNNHFTANLLQNRAVKEF